MDGLGSVLWIVAIVSIILTMGGMADGCRPSTIRRSIDFAIERPDEGRTPKATGT